MSALTAETSVYLLTLALFGFVSTGSALLRHDMLILACIPPVFVSLIVGFTMLVYAAETFGLVPTGLALAIGVLPACLAARRFTARRLLLAIYLAWAASLICALVAFGFPDHPSSAHA